LNWNQTLILECRQSGGNGSNDAIEDMSLCLSPGTASTVTALKDSGAANTGNGFAYILSHPAMNVGRASASKTISNNNSYVNEAFPAITLSQLDESCIEWTVFSDGSGTAHGRGSLNARLTSLTNLQSWVHRSGNTGTYRYGAADLSNINGTIPAQITSIGGDDVIGNTELNIPIVGAGFDAVQGTGTVTLTQNLDGSGTNVAQTNIDSWSDTNIQFDIIAGALADTNCFLRIVTDGGAVAVRAVQVGLPPETYLEAIEGLTNGPTHIWTFQNTYNDEVGSATANNSTSGTPTFVTNRLLCRNDTHSIQLDSEGDGFGPANQTDMNDTSSAQRRYIGGWLMLDRISQTLAVLWEEGAQVNNIALLNGFGNNPQFQFADAGGDYAQCFFDVNLTPNRPYHILGEFNSSNHKSGICAVWLDGVKQTESNGNPWTVSAFPSHTGNISWGQQSNEDLKVGDDRGVDATIIEFVSPVECNYSHWASWIDSTMNDVTEIRETLFAKGALCLYDITGADEAALQSDLDTQCADTLVTDFPGGIRLPSIGSDYTLTFDNITFEDRVSAPIIYMGAAQVTIILANGSDIDESKCEAPFGGSFVFQRPSLVTLTGAPNGSTIVIQDASDESEIDRVQSSSGNFAATVSVASINYIVIADDFKPLIVRDVAISGDTTIPVVLDNDYAYDNP
jgi:hypothetical protein